MPVTTRVAVALLFALAATGVSGAVIYDGNNQILGLSSVSVLLGSTTTEYAVEFQRGEYGAVFGTPTTLPAGWPFANSGQASVAVAAIAAALNSEAIGNVAFAGGQATAYVPYNVGFQASATAPCDFCAASRAVSFGSIQWAALGSTPFVKTALTTSGGSAGPDVTYAQFTAVPLPGAAGLLLTGLGLLVARRLRLRS